MKSFQCNVNMDNQAFENESELASILNDIAFDLLKGNTGKSIVDSNGNKVGQWVIQETEGE